MERSNLFIHLYRWHVGCSHKKVHKVSFIPGKEFFLNAKTQLSEPKTATKQYWETGSHGSFINEEVMETNVMFPFIAMINVLKR